MTSTLRRDIGSVTPFKDGSTDTDASHLECDVLIVGAGFGGVYLLHRLRDELGLNAKIYEAGKNLGGIWHWNTYPGARVDSPVPVYEYSFPKVWKSWTWSQKFPDWSELQKYFEHVDKVLDVKKDVSFESKVISSEFDQEANVWTTTTENGKTARSKYLILATGFAAKRHFPDWKGLDTFKGEIHHSSFWPEGGVDFKGKKAAVVGTGATGIQLSQEVAKTAKEFTLIQRTPNLCLPMMQRKMTAEEQENRKDAYDKLFQERLTTFAGFPFDFHYKDTFTDSPEEREKFFDYLWELGGFNFWIGTYKDVFFNAEANRSHYDYWNKKVRARITNPEKREVLAPSEPPHPFGTKRPSLEQDFYETMDKDSVSIIDVNKNPIKEVVPEGIITEDGKLHELDILALATGFDSVTGGMKNMGLKDVNGIELAEKWKPGTFSYLGMTCADYPNMFFLYGAQGPTAFSNGPTCIDCQGAWIFDTIAKMKKENLKKINATKEAETEWHKLVQDLNNESLFPQANSWYMGANIPGKPREQLNFTGGFPRYEKEIRKALDGWQGFEVTKN